MIVANALAWALLHALWEGAAIALILAVSLWALRSAHLRYLAACVALAATLAGFVITFIRLIPPGYAVGPNPSLHAVPVGGDVPWFTPVAPEGIVLPPWIAPLWLAGVLVFQLRALGGWMAVRRLRRTGVCIAAEPWQTWLSELASGLGIDRPVTLLQSSLAEGPVVIGHLRPVILVPISLLTGLPCAQVGAILIHELAHIRRHDYLVNLLQTFAEGLLFYHPGVWWMSHVIRTERENCCDDVAVASSGDAHEYATALAALAESRWGAHDAAMAASGGNLVKRIRRWTGPQILAEVRPDRAVWITVPIDHAAAQVTGFTRITTTSGIPVGTQNFQENGTQPYFRTEWKSLDPGTYTVTTVVTDSPSGKVHTWTVPVTIN